MRNLFLSVSFLFFAFAAVSCGSNKKEGQAAASERQLTVVADGVQTLVLDSLKLTWIKDNADYKFISNDGVVFAYPSYCADFMEGLRTKLKVVHAGIVLAASKGKNFQPCHSLAMSNVLADDAFVVAEIDYEDAISYLRTESVVLDSGIPKGYVLLKYKGVPLGFVKNVGGRANNLYPQEWRIRSGYMPENIVCL